MCSFVGNLSGKIAMAEKYAAPGTREKYIEI